MEIILLERIEKLGQMGDLVRVKDGYARNHLLPAGKALRATRANRERFERERAQLEAANLERRAEAEDIAGRMEGLSVAVVRQAGDAGQLYGSVNARDIAEAVTASGYTVARRQVALDRPIKALGLYPARLVLHPEVAVTVKVNVARSDEEARLQAAGIDVTARDLDDEDTDEAAALFDDPTPDGASGAASGAAPGAAADNASNAAPAQP